MLKKNQIFTMLKKSFDLKFDKMSQEESIYSFPFEGDEEEIEEKIPSSMEGQEESIFWSSI